MEQGVYLVPAADGEELTIKKSAPCTQCRESCAMCVVNVLAPSSVSVREAGKTCANMFLPLPSSGKEKSRESHQRLASLS